MSNLRNSNHTKKLISEPHPQKVKRKNEVYKDIQ